MAIIYEYDEPISLNPTAQTVEVNYRRRGNDGGMELVEPFRNKKFTFADAGIKVTETLAQAWTKIKAYTESL